MRRVRDNNFQRAWRPALDILAGIPRTVPPALHTDRPAEHDWFRAQIGQSVTSCDLLRRLDGSSVPPGSVMPPQSSAMVRPRTKQEFVYQRLRNDIMRCDLAPGDRIVIDEVARRLEVSIIPVREALQLLQSEGLIVNTPHVGATVAAISRESVLDVFTLLEALGQVATRLVAERGSPRELDELERFVTAMDAAVASLRHEAWAELNTEFHMAIGALPGLPMLQEMTARVFDRWHRVRRFFFRGVLLHRVEQAQREHRQMLAAMRARQFDVLRDIVRQHNQGALASYLEYLDTRPALTSALGSTER
jgi:DNA-binding GntR family transcriptional regulator